MAPIRYSVGRYILVCTSLGIATGLIGHWFSPKWILLIAACCAVGVLLCAVSRRTFDTKLSALCTVAAGGLAGNLLGTRLFPPLDLNSPNPAALAVVGMTVAGACWTIIESNLRVQSESMESVRSFAWKAVLFASLIGAALGIAVATTLPTKATFLEALAMLGGTIGLWGGTAIAAVSPLLVLSWLRSRQRS